MSMGLEVIKLIFAVLDVSFNRGHYIVIIKRQFLYINRNRSNLRFDTLPGLYLGFTTTNSKLDVCIMSIYEDNVYNYSAKLESARYVW